MRLRILKCILHKTKVYLSSPLELYKNNYNQVQKISIQKLKWLKSLQMKKNRDKEGCFIIEGEKISKECIDSIPDQIHLIACLSDVLHLIPSSIQDKCHVITKKELERVSKLKTPNKLIVILNKPDIILFKPKEKFLILDNIQDPGNLGTIIRTADWFGINQIICSLDSADLYNSKTLQSSMGSFMRVQVFYKELIPLLSSHKFNIAGALLHGSALSEKSLLNSNAIMLGNEGKGISLDLERFCTNPVKISGTGGAESLNVSIAASILMYEWTK